jgi:hypothetical protein
VKDISGDGHVKNVLKIKVWGGIRVGSVDGDLGLERDVRVVKGVRIGRLYREGHGNGRRRERERRGMVERRVMGMRGSGGRERTGEIVGERPPVG